MSPDEDNKMPSPQSESEVDSAQSLDPQVAEWRKESGFDKKIVPSWMIKVPHDGQRSSVPEENDSLSNARAWEDLHPHWEEYKPTVLALCRTIWPFLSPDKISAEHLSFGGNNRVTAVTLILPGQSGIEKSFVIRTPLLDDDPVDVHLACHRLAEQYLRIPTARIIKADLGTANQLGSPYLLQRRAQGINLNEYPFLAHDEKLQIARELGLVYRKLLDVRWKFPGKPTMGPRENDTVETAIHVAKYDPAHCPDKSDEDHTGKGVPFKPLSGRVVLSEIQNLYEFMKSRIEAQKAHYIANPSEQAQNRDVIYYDCMLVMLEDLKSGGWLDDPVPYSLMHGDLQPRNLIYNKDSKGACLTVIDWDQAEFAPSFMGCAPPMWLWAPSKLDYSKAGPEAEIVRVEDPRGRLTPDNIPAIQIKKAFEDAAGREYMRLANDPAYRLARRLYWFVIEGAVMTPTRVSKECLLMLAEWSETRDELEKPNE